MTFFSQQRVSLNRRKTTQTHTYLVARFEAVVNRDVSAQSQSRGHPCPRVPFGLGLEPIERTVQHASRVVSVGAHSRLVKLARRGVEHTRKMQSQFLRGGERHPP